MTATIIPLHDAQRELRDARRLILSDDPVTVLIACDTLDRCPCDADLARQRRIAMRPMLAAIVNEDARKLHNKQPGLLRFGLAVVIALALCIAATTTWTAHNAAAIEQEFSR